MIDVVKGPINRWWIVVSGAMACAVGAGVVGVFALSVFLKDIAQEFGWPRSAVTAGSAFFFLTSGIGSIVLGRLLERNSIRLVTSVSVFLFAAALMAVGTLSGSLVWFCLLFAVMGFFGSAATAMPYALAIAPRFDTNRGLALALMVSGTGAGALLLPSYANFLREGHGWRVGYLGIGALVGIVSLTALLLFFSILHRTCSYRGKRG